MRLSVFAFVFAAALIAFALESFGATRPHNHTTDVNDEETPAYNVVDMDIRYDLPWFNDKGAYVQLNVTNLFDEDYFANISSGTNAKAIADVNVTNAVTARAANTAFVSVGAPRTVQVTFSARF